MVRVRVRVRVREGSGLDALLLADTHEDGARLGLLLALEEELARVEHVDKGGGVGRHLVRVRVRVEVRVRARVRARVKVGVRVMTKVVVGVLTSASPYRAMASASVSPMTARGGWLKTAVGTW